MNTVFELTPTNNRKSFYGKAKVFIENNIVKLLSYDTFVAEYNLETKEFIEKGKFSRTTSTHIKEFKTLVSKM